MTGNRMTGMKDGLPTQVDELVSIIIPVHDRMKLIPRAIKSVVQQTYRNLEILVIDDGSSQAIDGVIEAFNDERIVLLRHDINKGVAAARNTGIKAAHGDFITFLDSDDEYHPMKVEKQLAHLRAFGREEVVSYCRVEDICDRTMKVIEVSDFRQEGNILSQALRSCCITMFGMMMRKELLEKAGPLDESLRKYEDWDFLIRLAHLFRFSLLDEVLVRAHWHDQGQLSRDVESSVINRKEILARHLPLYRADNLAHSIFLADLAYHIAARRGKSEARRLLVKSIALTPFRFDPYIKFVHVQCDRVKMIPPPWT
jgi:glycosyltransferase involved in cell wall biosynthesis